MICKPLKFILLLLLTGILAGAGMDIPYLTGRVNDNAHVLTGNQLDSLSEMLLRHENLTTNQVVVLTIASLEGNNIEDYAYRVFNEWGLGQKGQDNGVLIVVAPNDRRMRIEVGYGLEAVLTDLTTSHIIQNVMAPRFREGDFNSGIMEGTRAVVNVLEGKNSMDLPVTIDGTGSEAPGFYNDFTPDMTITERILIGSFIFGIIGLFTVMGILTPGFGWFIYFFLIPFWAMFPIVVLGTKGALICLITYLISYPAAKLYVNQTEWYKKARKDLRTTGSASVGGLTFSSGSSGSSWSSGSSSSSGSRSFSGGGGRSGGGGSSGGW